MVHSSGLGWPCGGPPANGYYECNRLVSPFYCEQVIMTADRAAMSHSSRPAGWQSPHPTSDIHARECQPRGMAEITQDSGGRQYYSLVTMPLHARYLRSLLVVISASPSSHYTVHCCGSPCAEDWLGASTGQPLEPSPPPEL